MIGSYTLKPTEAGTEMTFAFDYEASNPIFWILFKLYNYFKTEKDIERALEKLKSILEK